MIINNLILILLVILFSCGIIGSLEPFVSSKENVRNDGNNLRRRNLNDKNKKSEAGYRVNLINQCPVTVLSAALGPTPVGTSNGSWVLKPGEKLSIDVPKEWESTAGNPNVNGPRFWAHTGCTYDVKSDRASCEGADCGGKYNCSAANKGGSPPGTWAEFCFNCGDNLTYYDVSLVDGAHMSMDIKPVNHSKSRPGNQGDPFWCKSGLCNKNQDLRDPKICPKEFQLPNKQLKNHNPNASSNITACFSNCGKWAYEKGLLGSDVTCDPNRPHPNKKIENICQNWRKYCCQSPSSGKACKTDRDCLFGEACWNSTCQCRAYYLNLKCDPKVCTHPYCECRTQTHHLERPKNIRANHKVKPKSNETITSKNCDNSVCPQGFSTQPLPKKCTISQGCVGDDTFHQVCTQSYTWPNDPQTYNCDAKEYDVTFCPGGTPVKMSDSIANIPDCQTLQKFPEYGYEKALQDCSIDIKNNKTFACARKTSHESWACGIDQNASCYNLGVLCQFNKNNK